MKTGLSDTAAEYIFRNATFTRLAKAVVPYAGELLYLNRMLVARHPNEPIILCYHGVVPDEVAADSQGHGNLVSVSEFSEQMSLLAQTMTPIYPSALENWLNGSGDLPSNPMLITFDDGYRNNFVHAAPILLKFGIPAIFFPTVSHIGTNRLLWTTEVYRSILLWPSAMVPLPDGSTIAVPANDLQKRRLLAGWVREYCKTLDGELKDQYLLHLREADLPPLGCHEVEMFSFLSWEETAWLYSVGFTIGSHTMDHSILTRIGRDSLRSELEGSREHLEKHLGASCTAIAYPNGGRADYSPQVLSDVAQAGYKLGFTTETGPCTRRMNPLALSRICIPGNLSRLGFQSRISGLHDLLKSSLR